MAAPPRPAVAPETVPPTADETASVEHAIHLRLALIAAAAGLILSPALSFTLQAPEFVAVPALVYGLVMLAIYLASRRGRDFVKLTYAITLVLIAAAWFPSSGSQGSTIVYQSAALIYAIVVLRGKARAIAIAALVSLTLGLITIEHRFPELVQPFANPGVRAIQVGVGFLAATLISTLVLGAVVSAYDRERQRLGESIDALHRSQEALAESESTLTALLNSTRDLVWLVEPAGLTLTRFNAAFANDMRERRGITLTPGLPLASLCPPEEAAQWVEACRRALADGPLTTEVTVTPQQTFLCSISPVTHASRVVGVSAFCVDITGLRQQQQERAQLERQLLQGQKMESLGRLAGGVAHDFNNMLSAILGYAEILRDEETDPQKVECLNAIEGAATRSGELTRKLLAFGRRGKNIVEAVSLNTIVKDCLVMLAPSLRADVTVASDLAATALVDGDPSQIGQIVLNLCLNANEAMPEGGVLRVTTRDVATPGSPGEWVELTVQDTGIGMTEEVQARIFEPFFTTKPGGTVSGTGLGLATVDGVVHLHGGSVRVESTPGRGSTFIVRLPRGTLAQSRPAGTQARPADGGVILVVDDEPLVRQVISMSVQSLGYRPVTAGDGIEALAVFDAQHDSLSGVVLDLKMPRMSGRDTFMAMRTRDARVPVLICSGYGENEEVEELVRAGARGLVKKPFTRQALASALAQFQR